MKNESPLPRCLESEAPLPGACWIWCDDLNPNSYVHLRKCFDLDRAPAAATLRITADSRFMVWINDHYVGQGPGVCRVPFFRVDTFDVGACLRPGRNVLAVLAHYTGIPTHTYRPGLPGLLCRLDGPTPAIVSDATWKARLSTAWERNVPRRTWAVGFTEVYDAAKEVAEWTGLSYDDAAWPAARIVAREAAHPLPRITPPLEEFFAPARAVVGAWRAGNDAPAITGATPPPLYLDAEPLAPLSDGDYPQRMSGPDLLRIVPPLDGSAVAVTLDLGEEMCGHVELDLTAQAGVQVDACLAELLGADGRAWCHRKGNLFMVRYRTAEGRRTWRNYQWNAGRYLHLVFRRLRGPITLHRAGVWRRRARLALRATFACDDPALNRIWQIGLHTFRECSHDAQVDCPTREQAPYWGDAIWVAVWTARLTGDASYLRHLLLSTPQVQMPDGQVPSSLFTGFAPDVEQVPASPRPTPSPVLFDYTLIMMIGLGEYAALTGDAATTRALIPFAEKAAAWYRERVGPSGLIEMDCAAMQRAGQGILFVDHPGLGWHNTPNGRPGLDRSGVSAALNAFYALALRALARVHRFCGDAGRAAPLEAEAARTAAALHGAFWRADRRVYVDAIGSPNSREQVSQQTNALLVLAEACPKSERAALLRRVLDESDPRLCVAGTYFWLYIARALCAEGLHAEALERIRALWTPMAEAGATTWWETFLGDELDSLCHVWSSVPNDFLLSEVLGLRVMPGAVAVEAHPQIGLLKAASGGMPLAADGSAMARAGWETTPGGGRRVWVDVNAAVPLTVRLPAGWRFADGGDMRTAQGPHRIETEAVRG